uniref:Uncharacterized protein n=1 Tax=Arundo donax TaxID=35708 RepID=A0A0A9A1R3_ARUDO
MWSAKKQKGNLSLFPDCSIFCSTIMRGIRFFVRPGYATSNSMFDAKNMKSMPSFLV